ncbi:MAG: hypothetical protein HQL71_09200 [Magnetococcales bacterium]|nr:hypothetical protein [Magnetococcales bacterium]
MHSSTSSSNNTFLGMSKTHQKAHLWLLLFAVLFGGLMNFIFHGYPRHKGNFELVSDAVYKDFRAEVENSDLLPAYTSRTGHLDHSYYYIGLPEMLTHLKGAKMLFLGNSRIQFGINDVILKPHLEAMDIPFHMLAFGHGEKSEFAMRLIEKFNLKPEIIVLNGNPGYFNPYLTERAEKVIEEDDSWYNRQSLWLTLFIATLHEINHFMPANKKMIPKYWMSRSRVTGSWQFTESFHKNLKNIEFQALPHCGPLGAKQIENILKFKKRILKLIPNVKLISLQVPFPGSCSERPIQVAKLLGGQAFYYHPDKNNPMATIDQSHLTKKNQNRYTKALADYLKNNKYLSASDKKL